MENSCSFSESAVWLMLCPIEVTCHFYRNLSCAPPVSKVVVCLVLADSESPVTWSTGCTGVASGCTSNAGGWGFALKLLCPPQAEGQQVGRLLHNSAKLQHLRNIKPAFVWKCLAQCPNHWELAIRPECITLSIKFSPAASVYICLYWISSVPLFPSHSISFSKVHLGIPSSPRSAL